MQGLTLIGSGWHPHLFRAEIKALTGPLEVIRFGDPPPLQSRPARRGPEQCWTSLAAHKHHRWRTGSAYC